MKYLGKIGNDIHSVDNDDGLWHVQEEKCHYFGGGKRIYKFHNFDISEDLRVVTHKSIAGAPIAVINRALEVVKFIQESESIQGSID